MFALSNAFLDTATARRDGVKFEDKVYDCVRADRFSVYAKNVRGIYYCKENFMIRYLQSYSFAMHAMSQG